MKDIGFAKLDFARRARTGFGETVFGPGKTPEQMVGIFRAFRERRLPVLATRCTVEQADALAAAGVQGLEGGATVPPKENLWQENPPLYLNIKFPNLTPEQMKAFYELPYVHYLCQTDNDAAKQRREMGFCEILIGGSPDPSRLCEQLEEIEKKFPDIIEPAFFDTAKKMTALLLKK